MENPAQKKGSKKEILPIELKVKTQPLILKAMLKKLKENPQIKEQITIKEEDLVSITFFIEK